MIEEDKIKYVNDVVDLYSTEEVENFKPDVFTDEQKKDLKYLKNLADKKLNPDKPFTDPENWNAKVPEYLNAKAKKQSEQEHTEEMVKLHSTPYLDVPLNQAPIVKAVRNGRSPNYYWDHKKEQFFHRKTKKIAQTKDVVADYEKTGPRKYELKPVAIDLNKDNLKFILDYEQRILEQQQNQLEDIKAQEKFNQLTKTTEETDLSKGIGSLIGVS